MANSFGTYAALPAFPSGHVDGERYFCTDAPYYFVANAGLWDAYYEGNPCIIPPTGFVGDNFSSPLVLDQTRGYMSIRCLNDYGGSAALCMAAPTGAYKITMGCRINPINESTYGQADSQIGLGFKNSPSAGNYTFLQYGVTTFELAAPTARGLLQLQSWSDIHTPITRTDILDRGIFASFVGKNMFFQIEDDGISLLTYRIGLDKNNLRDAFTATYVDLPKPDTWAIYIDAGRGTDVIIFDLNGVSVGPPPLEITCASSSATVGIPYDSFLSATGGVPPYTFSILTGTLPPGLSLNSATGEITGTPTLGGDYPYTAQVEDDDSHTATISCSIHVTTPVTVTPCDAVIPAPETDNSFILQKVVPGMRKNVRLPVRGNSR